MVQTVNGAAVTLGLKIVIASPVRLALIVVGNGEALIVSRQLMRMSVSIRLGYRAEKGTFQLCPKRVL
jgi:hypothetical protein